MKKQDIIMVVILSLLLVFWTMFGQKLTGGNQPPPPSAASTNTFSITNGVGALAKAEAITAPEKKAAVAATNAVPVID